MQGSSVAHRAARPASTVLGWREDCRSVAGSVNQMRRWLLGALASRLWCRQSMQQQQQRRRRCAADCGPTDPLENSWSAPNDCWAVFDTGDAKYHVMRQESCLEKDIIHGCVSGLFKRRRRRIEDYHGLKTTEAVYELLRTDIDGIIFCSLLTELFSSLRSVYTRN